MDGFHREAGSQNLIEIHGDLHDVYCAACGYRRHVEDYDELEFPPRCPKCRAVLRPDVVLFGELLPPEKVQTLYAESAAGSTPCSASARPASFPTSSQPVLQAQRGGRPTIEINPGTARSPTWSMSNCRVRAAPALDAVWTRFRERQGEES